MELQEVIQKTKKLIADGDVDKALDILFEYTTSHRPDLETELMNLSSRFRQAKMDFEMRNIISRDEYERLYAKTVLGIGHFWGELSKIKHQSTLNSSGKNLFFASTLFKVSIATLGITIVALISIPFISNKGTQTNDTTQLNTDTLKKANLISQDISKKNEKKFEDTLNSTSQLKSTLVKEQINKNEFERKEPNPKKDTSKTSFLPKETETFVKAKDTWLWKNELGEPNIEVWFFYNGDRYHSISRGERGELNFEIPIELKSKGQILVKYKSKESEDSKMIFIRENSIFETFFNN